MKIPDWFKTAIEQPFEDRTVEVDGIPIHYLAWPGDPKKPGLVFVHGSGAHAHWWTFIAPFFTQDYRVLALDLAGAGDSGYSEHYSGQEFAAQVAGVARDAGFGSNTIVVGHSVGGYITLKTALFHADLVTGVVLVDSAIRPPDLDWNLGPQKGFGKKKTYESFEQALGRFRLMPVQECENDFIVDYIGRHSLKQVEGGWSWKFDDELNRKFDHGDLTGELAQLECRVGLIYGEDSVIVTREVIDFMFERLGKSVPVVGIPESQHHVFLDQPLAFVSALRTMLAEWRHSTPDRGRRSG